jgi:hypothetical protein
MIQCRDGRGDAYEAEYQATCGETSARVPLSQHDRSRPEHRAAFGASIGGGDSGQDVTAAPAVRRLPGSPREPRPAREPGAAETENNPGDQDEQENALDLAHVRRLTSGLTMLSLSETRSQMTWRRELLRRAPLKVSSQPTDSERSSGRSRFRRGRWCCGRRWGWRGGGGRFWRRMCRGGSRGYRR